MMLLHLRKHLGSWQMSRLRTAGVQARECSRRAQAMVGNPFRITRSEYVQREKVITVSIQEHDQQGAS